MKMIVTLIAVLFLGFTLGFITNQVCRQEEDCVPPEETCAIIGDKGTYYQALGLAGLNVERASDICELIASERRRNWCYQDVAAIVADKNVSVSLELCSRITEGVIGNSCLRDAAVVHSSTDAVKAKEICEGIDDSSVSNTCLALVYVTNKGKAISYCNAITDEQDRDACLQTVG